MKQIWLALLLAGILLLTAFSAVVGALLLDPWKLDFTLTGRILFTLGIEMPDPDDVYVCAYELLLCGSVGCMTALIIRQMYTVHRRAHGGMSGAGRLRSRRMQVILGGLAAVMLLAAGGLLACRASILLALIPGVALAARWMLYVLWQRGRA